MDAACSSTSPSEWKKRKSNTLLQYFPAIANEVGTNAENKKTSKGIPTYFGIKKTKPDENISHKVDTKANNLSCMASSLPLEVLVKICFFLDAKDILKVGNVCRQWREAGTIVCNTCLDLSWCSEYQRKNLPSSFSRRFVELRDLKLGFWEVPPSELLDANKDSLTKINIDGCSRFGERIVRDIATYCPNLRTLRWRDADAILPDYVQMLFEGKEPGIRGFFNQKKLVGCKNIEKLDLSGASKMHVNALGIIVRNCKQLRSLNVNRCRFVDDWFPGQNSLALRNIAECKTLTHLSFGGLSITPTAQDPTWTSLGERLLSLDVSGTAASSAQFVTSYCGKLEKLKIKNCSLLLDELCQIMKNCPNLKKLYIDSNKVEMESSLLDLFRTCNTLQLLSCSGCWTLESLTLVKETMPWCTILA